MFTSLGYVKVEAQGTTPTAESNPLSSQFNNAIVDVDTTNLSVATHYFPSANGFSMDYLRDLSLSGKLLDADGILTFTMEVTNDEDVDNADWNTVKMFDDEAGALVSSVTVSSGTELFSLSMPNANYRYVRFALVVNGATNTVVMKGRAKAL